MTLLSRVYIDKENRNTLFEKKIKRLVVVTFVPYYNTGKKKGCCVSTLLSIYKKKSTAMMRRSLVDGSDGLGYLLFKSFVFLIYFQHIRRSLNFYLKL